MASIRHLVATVLLGTVMGVVPQQALACEASVANHIVRGEYEQAAQLFATPAGKLDAMAASRLQARLRQVAAALRMEGQPTPLIRPAPDDTALVVRVGHEPRAGEKLFFHRSVFLVDSRVAPGLRLAVHTTMDPNQCAVYSVAFEGRSGDARRILASLQGER